MPATHNWTLVLTPPGEPATTLTNVPHDEVFRILDGMLYGEPTRAGEAEERAA
jgi:hypothetical protein